MKTGRNDPCHCGSGKKFKHCHGLSANAGAQTKQADDKRRDAAILVQRALQLHQAGSLSEAQQLYGRVLAMDPDNSDAIHFSGYLAYQTGNLEAAQQLMRRSIKLNPQASQYHGNLGMVLMQLEQLDEAEVEFRLSLDLNGQNAESRNNLGSVLQIRGRYDLALACFERAIALRPGYIDAINNLGTSLSEMHRFDAAAEQYRRALAADPANADAHYFSGFVFFNQGRLSDGWSECEWRFHPRLNPRYRVIQRPFPAPKWEGQDLAGRTLLVAAEQGIGDQIWAAGMIGSLAHWTQNNARVVIECAPKLEPLFRRSFDWAEVVPRISPPDPKCLQGVDYQISGASLGKIVRPDLAAFPGRKETQGAYLFADKTREQYWRTRVAGLGAGLKVGISWRSNNIRGERALACTRLTQWAKVMAVRNVHFVNLQYDECEAELREAETSFGVEIARFPEVDMFDDLDETAALMRSLDLVIGAPTSVAILSAALGVMTWEMSSGSDWQCFGQANNPMYPAMQTYLKRWDQPWEEMLDRVALELAGEVQARETMRVSASRASAT